MISTEDAQTLLGSGGHVVDQDGDKIGKVGQVFLDERSGEPAWVTVKTGLFGTAESFVPLGEATVRGDDVVVPFDKATVKDAPRVHDADGHLAPEEEAHLYSYYGLGEAGNDDDSHDDRHDDDRSDDRSDQTVSERVVTDQSAPQTPTGGTSRMRRFVVTEVVTTVPLDEPGTDGTSTADTHTTQPIEGHRS